MGLKENNAQIVAQSWEDLFFFDATTIGERDNIHAIVSTNKAGTFLQLIDKRDTYDFLTETELAAIATLPVGTTILYPNQGALATIVAGGIIVWTTMGALAYQDYISSLLNEQVDQTTPLSFALIDDSDPAASYLGGTIVSIADTDSRSYILPTAIVISTEDEISVFPATFDLSIFYDGELLYNNEEMEYADLPLTVPDLPLPPWKAKELTVTAVGAGDKTGTLIFTTTYKTAKVGV